MRHPDRLLYGGTISDVGANEALRRIGRVLEGLSALLVLLSLAAGLVFLWGVCLGSGARVGWLLMERLFGQ